MTRAARGVEFTLARRGWAGEQQGPRIGRCTLQRIELELRHVWPEDAHKGLRGRLIRMNVGQERFLEDPRDCGGGWSVLRTA